MTGEGKAMRPAQLIALAQGSSCAAPHLPLGMSLHGPQVRQPFHMRRPVWNSTVRPLQLKSVPDTRTRPHESLLRPP